VVDRAWAVTLKHARKKARHESPYRQECRGGWESAKGGRPGFRSRSPRGKKGLKKRPNSSSLKFYGMSARKRGFTHGRITSGTRDQKPSLSKCSFLGILSEKKEGIGEHWKRSTRTSLTAPRKTCRKGLKTLTLSASSLWTIIERGEEI